MVGVVAVRMRICDDIRRERIELQLDLEGLQQPIDGLILAFGGGPRLGTHRNAVTKKCF